MGDTDHTQDTPPAQDKRLRIADAKSHMVVVVWNGSIGDQRYLYHDVNGWYVLGWPCAACDRHYLETDGEHFRDVTTP